MFKDVFVLDETVDPQLLANAVATNDPSTKEPEVREIGKSTENVKF